MSVPICASCTSCHQLWQFSWDIVTDHGKLIVSLVVVGIFFRLNFPVSQFRRASRVSELIFIVDAHCTMYSRFRYMLYETGGKITAAIQFFIFFSSTIFVRFIVGFFFLLDFFIAWSHWIPCHAFLVFIWASKQTVIAKCALSHFCNILKFNWLLFCIGFKLRAQQLFKQIFLAFIVVHPLCMRWIKRDTDDCSVMVNRLFENYQLALYDLSANFLIPYASTDKDVINMFFF